MLQEADFLGIIGLAREYGPSPAEPAVAYEQVLARHAIIEDRFILPRARELAAIRLERLRQYLLWLQEENFDFI